MRASPIFAVSLLIAVAVAAESKTPGAQLLDQLLAAVNGKDDAALRRFIEHHASSEVPTETRLARIKGLAERSAPLKLVRIARERRDELRGVLEDRNGERLGFVLELSDDAPPRLARLQLGPPELADPKPVKDYAGPFTTIAQLAADLDKDFESPAMTLAVIRDGQLEETATGLRELGKPEPVTPTDAWSIGSIGKPICTTVVAKLIEAGKLRWDTTLAEAFPELKMRPGYGPVTLEQIMKHRGGIPEDGGFRKPRIDAIVGDAKTPEGIRARYVADILGREPIARPGTTFAYSNAGYALLAHIAERVAHKPYEQLVRELVFQPLGLQHSYAGAETFPKELPSGHVPTPDGLRPVSIRGPLERMFAGAGGGIYMSAGDLARFGQAHLQGLLGKDGLLEAATVERLHQGELEGGPAGGRYACGWGLHQAPGIEPWHGHNGSNGTFRAELAIFPKAKLVVVGIVNRGGEMEPSPGLVAVLTLGRRFAPQ